MYKKKRILYVSILFVSNPLKHINIIGKTTLYSINLFISENSWESTEALFRIYESLPNKNINEEDREDINKVHIEISSKETIRFFLLSIILYGIIQNRTNKIVDLCVNRAIIYKSQGFFCVSFFLIIDRSIIILDKNCLIAWAVSLKNWKKKAHMKTPVIIVRQL